MWLAFVRLGPRRKGPMQNVALVDFLFFYSLLIVTGKKKHFISQSEC